MTVRRVAALVAALALLVGLLLFGREAAARVPAFVAWVRALGFWGPAAFILAYGIAAVLLFPAVLLTLAGGALWGVGLGTVYVMLGAALGSTMAFFASRYLVRGFVQRYVDHHPKLAAIDRAVEIEGLRLVFLLRLSPVVPFIFLNYVLGISRVRYRDFIGGLFGMIPAAVMYVYAGKVAGDLASLASGAAMPRGPAYYTLIALGLGATILATVLITRAAQRAVQQKV
jgi:uncharacterized membrane protein YdjX (TVP38/TMEM64 family)